MNTTSLQFMKKEGGRTILAERPKTITSYDPVTFVLLSEVPRDLMFIKEISLTFRIFCQYDTKIN